MKSGGLLNRGCCLYYWFGIGVLMYIMGFEWLHGAQRHIDSIPYFIATLVNGIDTFSS